MTSSFLRWLASTLALLVAFLATSPARASQPTIEEGREADVLALFSPFQLGGDVAEGWKLWNVAIQPTWIELGLRGPGDQEVQFVLVHPRDGGRDAIRTRSFALKEDVADLPGARSARHALIEAVRRNDKGAFWRTQRPISPTAKREISHLRLTELASDGVVLTILGAFLIIALTFHALTTAPRFVRVALPLVVGLGIGLRVALSPEAFLGAWPWSRIWPNVGIIWTSPVFANLAADIGKPVYFTDLMLWVNFGYACVMPVMLFVHASQLLRDTRAGLAAATIVALSPHHIRFSRCEDAFVPSLVLTSLAFALIHTFMRDPSRLWRWIALVALPFALWSGYLLRPLNILFVGVYLAAIVLLHPEQSPMRRRLLVGGVVGGVWIAAFLEFLDIHRGQVIDAATDMTWLFRVPLTLIWPPWNMLIHPLVTPPALLVLAALGYRWLTQRGEARLAVFLLGWLGIFFIAHAYVVSTPMQPRYHLHLLVPFTLLASTAVVEAFRRSRRLFVVTAVSVALAPWISFGWIRDIGYSDTLEYSFVRQARDMIPEGCTVIEYVGPDPGMDHDSRFKRVGHRLAGAQYGERFSTVLARLESSDTDDQKVLPLDARDALARGQDACVYVYEGLGCWGQKRTDEAYAPACQAMVDAAPLETVMEEWIPYRPYDGNVTRGVAPGTEHLRLALSRVVSRSDVAEVR